MIKKLAPTNLFGFLNDFDSKEKTKKKVKLNLTAIFLITFFMLSPDLLNSGSPVYVILKPLAIFFFLLISMVLSATFIQVLFKRKVSFGYAMKYVSTVKMLLVLASMPYVLGSTQDASFIYIPLMAFPVLIAIFIYASSVFTSKRAIEADARASEGNTGIEEEYGFSANMDDFDGEPVVAGKGEVLIAMVGHIFKVFLILFIMVFLLKALA
tara:strand:- start:188 stop:820 length:633 start_codon:yes stop_codon:yes gene_type:complete